MNFLSLFICLFLIPIVLGGDVYIKTILSSTKISDVKRDPKAPNQGDKNDWYNTFIREGKAMLPFVKKIIKERAESDPEKSLQLGAFLSLVGQGGGVLALMGLLKEEGYNVSPGSIVVVVDPKPGRDIADFKACMQIIQKYGIKENVLRVDDKALDQGKFKEAISTLQVVEMNNVLEKLNGAKFLAVALCGPTFNDIKEKGPPKNTDSTGSQLQGAVNSAVNNTANQRVSDALKGALEVLPNLSPVGQTDKTVFSPNTPSGKDERGNWPIPNVEHKCTHVATLTWPIESVMVGNEIQVFVNVEKVEETGEFPTFLESMLTENSKEKIGDFKTQVDDLQKNYNFKTRKWVELKGLHFV